MHKQINFIQFKCIVQNYLLKFVFTAVIQILYDPNNVNILNFNTSESNSNQTKSGCNMMVDNLFT